MGWVFQDVFCVVIELREVKQRKGWLELVSGVGYGMFYLEIFFEMGFEFIQREEEEILLKMMMRMMIFDNRILFSELIL